MSDRFADIDLQRLPPPAAIEQLDVESYLSARMADLVQRFAAVGIDYDVSSIETDPFKILEEVDSYRELLVRGRVNDAVRAVLLATATGTDLDNIVAEYGVLRQTITPANPATNTPAVMESDDALRERGQLAWEALSTAGPAGAYLFQARSAHPQVADAGIYGPQSGEVDPGQVLVSLLSNQATDDAIAAAVASLKSGQLAAADADQLVATLLASQGDGTASSAAIASVTQHLEQDEVRPLTDQVIVESSTPVNFAISATQSVFPGPDAETIRQAGLARVIQYVFARRKVGLGIDRLALGAALFVPDDTGVPVVEQLAIATPADDVVTSNRHHPICTGITLSVEVLS